MNVFEIPQNLFKKREFFVLKLKSNSNFHRCDAWIKSISISYLEGNSSRPLITLFMLFFPHISRLACAKWEEKFSITFVWETVHWGRFFRVAIEMLLIVDVVEREKFFISVLVKLIKKKKVGNIS